MRNQLFAKLYGSMTPLVMPYSSGLHPLFKAADFIIPSHYIFLLNTYYAQAECWPLGFMVLNTIPAFVKTSSELDTGSRQ